MPRDHRVSGSPECTITHQMPFPVTAQHLRCINQRDSVLFCVVHIHLSNAPLRPSCKHNSGQGREQADGRATPITRVSH